MRVATLALCGVLAVTAACSGDGTAPAPAVEWSKVDLPAEPVALATGGDELLVGLRARGAKVVPRLVVLAGGKQREVKVEPSSPYAFEAVWKSIAYDGRRVLALGGAPGGAHSNVRWTVWTGTTDTLTEHPQVFSTFGGQSAGSLYGAVLTPSGQALLGSWASSVSGTDAAVWLPQGHKWTRQDSTGTALRSTASLLVGPGAATTVGEGIVQTGSQVRLAPNVVQQQAAVWRSTTLNEGWTRIELPEPGSRSQGLNVSCAPELCTIAGSVEGKLALWQLEPSGTAKRLANVPAIAIGDKDALPPPIRYGDRVVQVIAEGGKVKVVSGRDGSWTVQESTGPTGVVKDARLVGRTLHLIAGPPDGPAELWTTELT